MTPNHCGQCGSSVGVIKTTSPDPKVERLWCMACRTVTRIKIEDPLPSTELDELEQRGYGWAI